jgi:HSP20 family protein
MGEINVVKQPKPERPEIARWFEPPFFRGSLFGVNPFALMRQFTDDMDRMFAQAPRATGDVTGAWSPAVEVKEKEGKILVAAELPGVKKEDVKVHIEGNTLVVEGERKQEKEDTREGYYHSERSYGKFYRSILLPEGAMTDQTAAQFNNGVLEVTVPVLEAKAARKEIPVQEGLKQEGSKKAA